MGKQKLRIPSRIRDEACRKPVTARAIFVFFREIPKTWSVVGDVLSKREPILFTAAGWRAPAPESFGDGGYMRTRRMLYSLFALSAMLMTGFVLHAQAADSARINLLLQQAKAHAVQADLDAETVESYTRASTSWQSHARRLSGMRENVNELGKDVAALTDARPEASPWQQEAIDDVDPLLRSMADHLSKMINHLNENPGQIHLLPYKQYAKANVELSHKLSSTISDYVDYSKTKAKAEALEQKLQLAGETSSGE